MTHAMLAIVAVAGLLLLGSAVPAAGQNQTKQAEAQADDWPAEWFYGNRPETLTQLEGKPAPGLEIAEWHDGVEVRPEHMKGRVVIVDFWATWCGPCMAAIPILPHQFRILQSQGLAFVGVHDARRGWDRVGQVMSQGVINYPVGRDADGGVSTKAFRVPFWPTYIAIDRKGIVRAAGLRPDRVEHVVKALLAEPAPEGTGTGAPEAEPLDDRFLVNRSRRPEMLRELTGKALPQLAGQRWWRAGDEDASQPAGEELAGRVIAVQFLSVRNQRAMHQASLLAELEKGHGAAEFVALGVAPAEEDWERLTTLAAEGKTPSRLMLDAPLEDNRRALGAFAEACGVRYAPVTVLVDRRGVVRGAGVRPDKLAEAVELLLAEPKPEVEGEEGVAEGGGGG